MDAVKVHFRGRRNMYNGKRAVTTRTNGGARGGALEGWQVWTSGQATYWVMSELKKVGDR